MQVKYVINISDNEVQMLDGNLRIVKGGWEEISIRQYEHEDISSCERRNWIKISDIKPKGEKSPKPQVVSFEAPAALGKTLAETKKKKE